MTRFNDFLTEEDKKKKEADLPRNEKGEPDFIGTGVKPEDGWKTPEQRDAEAKNAEITQKYQEKLMIQAEKDKLQKRHDLIRSKLGRILATPEELEELDAEREEQEKIDLKKEQLKSEKNSQVSPLGEALSNVKKKTIAKTVKKKPAVQSDVRSMLIKKIKELGYEPKAKGVWATKSGKKGRITPDNKWEDIDDEKTSKSSAKKTSKSQGNKTQSSTKISGKTSIKPNISLPPISQVDIKAKAKKEFEAELLQKQKEKKKNIDKEFHELEKKSKTSKFTKHSKYPTTINGKDKSLDEKMKTSKEKAFTDTLYDPKKGDNKFYKKTKDYNGYDLSIKNRWETPSWLVTSGKVPIREIQIFERMMNTKLISSTEPPISFFTDGGPGGAGKIQAQAGELMTMIATSMSKKEMDEFKKSVEDHIAKQDPDSSTVTKDWLKASINNASAIHNRIEAEFDVDDASKVITHTCWDIKEDVEALGLKDYKKNKGFSSDIYIKLKLPNGQTILNEVSLKKDKNVFFLNSSTGKLKEWDTNLPKDIDPVVYAAKLKKSLSSSIDKNKIKKLLGSSALPEVKELQQMLSKNKAQDIDEFMSGNSRTARKILLTALKAQAAHGDKKSIDALAKIDKDGRQYSINAIKAIGSNPKLKKGMLEEVKSEFPLKAVTENEETMAIGDMSVDKKVVEQVFGTSDWDEIQEHLEAVTDKNPPFLAYKAKGKKDIIPIAIINVREDGVNYGAQFKFEMALDKRFAKLLKDANTKLYSKNVIGESALYKWIVYSKIEEDD